MGIRQGLEDKPTLLHDGVGQTPQKHHRKGLQRKNSIEIRNSILNSVATYPKTYREIALDVGSDARTILKYLKTLADCGSIRLADFRIHDVEKKLWIRVKA